VRRSVNSCFIGREIEHFEVTHPCGFVVVVALWYSSKSVVVAAVVPHVSFAWFVKAAPDVDNSVDSANTFAKSSLGPSLDDPGSLADPLGDDPIVHGSIRVLDPALEGPMFSVPSKPRSDGFLLMLGIIVGPLEHELGDSILALKPFFPSDATVSLELDDHFTLGVGESLDHDLVDLRFGRWLYLKMILRHSDRHSEFGLAFSGFRKADFIVDKIPAVLDTEVLECWFDVVEGRSRRHGHTESVRGFVCLILHTRIAADVPLVLGG